MLMWIWNDIKLNHWMTTCITKCSVGLSKGELLGSWNKNLSKTWTNLRHFEIIYELKQNNTWSHVKWKPTILDNLSRWNVQLTLYKWIGFIFPDLFYGLASELDLFLVDLNVVTNLVTTISIKDWALRIWFEPFGNCIRVTKGWFHLVNWKCSIKCDSPCWT